MSIYHKPAGEARTELEIKRSRFISIAAPVSDTAECQAFIQSVKDEFPDARHHCTAFIAGAPNNSQCYGMSDDGEPSGTAGKPMFNVLMHSGLGEIVVVIVRYFGGIKLGTGGLVKAYSQATQMVLDALDTEEVRPHYAVEIEADYAFESDIRHWLKELSARKVDCQYSQFVSLTAEVEEPDLLAERLQQSGQGRIRFKVLD
ncbi:YigZ family protein [Oceanospirillum linum]|uniref:YigZ family protein n=1 Tax=Oceanospirillum linum TaxID=966 RepID=A0A1T1HFB3_OCELI|nr:YigZ family protein [Oceanospirillum linum]OOV88506.1 YigZ family protein [Oceanospirillum linum]SEF58587.1 uncharacterized protein, YigZ family [Oleiphilus messinensis]SMP06459.1 uncharacterized protein, YigZ family [Oceanospirillum linum]